MPGALLDTHTLYWLVSGAADLTEDALAAIGENQEAGTLYVSPITSWELGVIAQKPPARRPDLGGLTPGVWFREAVAATGAKIVPVRQRIAIEAANVATDTGHKDPGDCFLIATARVRRIPIITRDGVMRDLARDRPDYLSVIEC